MRACANDRAQGVCPEGRQRQRLPERHHHELMKPECSTLASAGAAVVKCACARAAARRSGRAWQLVAAAQPQGPPASGRVGPTRQPVRRT